jgi:uridine kinase
MKLSSIELFSLGLASNISLAIYPADISGSFIIGDRTVDIQTGINANLNTILVNTGYAGSDNIYNVKPDFISENLLDAVNVILNLEDNIEIQIAIIKIKELVKLNKKLIKISICGLSRSGKSTLIKYFQQALLSNNIESIVIHLDYWIVPYSKRTSTMNVRDRYQYPVITADLSFLFKNNTVKFKPYESLTREISNEDISITLNNTRLIFIDGVISIDHPYVFSETDLKIFVQTDEEIRKNRFLEFYKSKNLPENEIEDLYIKRIHDENEIVNSSKTKADLIINL